MARTLPTPDYKTCKAQDIVEWCVANNKVDWLKTVARTCDRKFFVLRNKFFLTFAPEKMPVAAAKKPNVWDEIENL